MHKTLKMLHGRLQINKKNGVSLYSAHLYLKIMMKNTFAAILATGAIMLASCGQTQDKASGNEEATYETLEITLGDRTLTTEYSAAISGVQTVEIRPQVSGMITDILIEEGESVSKGQVLFVIDQTPYKAAYEIAVANVKRSRRPQNGNSGRVFSTREWRSTTLSRYGRQQRKGSSSTRSRSSTSRPRYGTPSSS